MWMCETYTSEHDSKLELLTFYDNGSIKLVGRGYGRGPSTSASSRVTLSVPQNEIAGRRYPRSADQGGRLSLGWRPSASPLLVSAGTTAKVGT